MAPAFFGDLSPVGPPKEFGSQVGIIVPSCAAGEGLVAQLLRTAD